MATRAAGRHLGGPPLPDPKFHTSGSFSSGENRPDQCTAISKRSGVRCQGPAIKGSPSQKCRMHGGHNGHSVGANNTQFKTGRHSKYLPAKLVELYEAARENPDLIEMSDHIALLEARIQSVLADSTAGDPVPRWAEINEAFAAAETAILQGANIDDTVSALEKVHKLLDAGMKWDRTWDQVLESMEQLRKLTDTEVKRKKELNQMVPIERVIILVGAVGDAVKRNVTDPVVVERINREIAALFGGSHTEGNQPRMPPDAAIIDVSPTKKTRCRKKLAAIAEAAEA